MSVFGFEIEPKYKKFYYIVLRGIVDFLNCTKHYLRVTVQNKTCLDHFCSRDTVLQIPYLTIIPEMFYLRIT